MSTLRTIIIIVTLACIAISINGCTSAERVGHARQVIDAAPDIMGEIDAKIATLQSDLDALIEANEARVAAGKEPDEMSVTAATALLEMLQSTADERDQVDQALSQARQILADDQTGWGIAQAIANTAGIIGIPGAGIAGVLLKRARDDFDGVVAAVAAGGGPRDSKAARDAMQHYHGLKQRVTMARVKIGDKRMEAVPSRDNEELAG